MNEKILVVYTSQTGSTAGVAEAIGKTLAQNGTQVDVRPMSDVKDLTPYRAVVAGSSIRGQKWLPEAMQFVQTHRMILKTKPFAAFMVCITLAMKGGERYREGIAAWLEPVRVLVKPVSEGMFAGGLDFSKLPFSDGLRMRVPVLLGLFPQGDHRDWDAIRAWAESIRPLLGG